MKPDKPHVSYEDIGSDDFDKLLQQLDAPQDSPSRSASYREVPPPLGEAGVSLSEASAETSATHASAAVTPPAGIPDDMVAFVWPEQFRTGHHQTQANMFRQWWLHDRTEAQLLLALLLAFNSAPVYASRDFICMVLREISRCLVTCLEASGSAAQVSIDTLEQWAAMLKHTKHDIQLRIPHLGRRVESAWMHSSSNAATVEAVYTWAIYSSGGIVYAAEIL